MSERPETPTGSSAGIPITSGSFQGFRERNNDEEEDMEDETVEKFLPLDVGQGSPRPARREMQKTPDLKRKGLDQVKTIDPRTRTSPERHATNLHDSENETSGRSFVSEEVSSDSWVRISRKEETFEGAWNSENYLPEKLISPNSKERSYKQVIESESLILEGAAIPESKKQPEFDARNRKASGSEARGGSEGAPRGASGSEGRGIPESVHHRVFDDEGLHKYLNVGIGALVILIFAAVIGCLSKTGSTVDNIPKKVEDPRRAKFLADLFNLEKYFPEQDQRFYMIVSSATKSIILNENPNDPAVILLVVPGETRASATLECFLSKYIPIVTEYFGRNRAADNAITFDASQHVSKSPADVKLELDEVLGNGFRKGTRVAVVKHLESLPGEAAKMFYSYCDNDNAPFKRVVIFLTLHLSKGESAGQGDEFAERVLASHWEEELGTDMFTPLLSRIGNSIAYLKSEKQQNLQKNGCEV